MPNPVKLRTVALTALAMIAFAGNSLLCRAALRDGLIDPATFTAIRLASGAMALLLIVSLRSPAWRAGTWGSAAALFAYAAAFSYAYVSLSTATGALLLFGAVQITMIGYGIFRGERLSISQSTGGLLAAAGVGYLLLPGLSAPHLPSALLMLSAGVAWGIYSLRGKGAGMPVMVTAGNFLKSLPLCLLLLIPAFMSEPSVESPAGVALAVASGALASGMGYAIWYFALPGLQATQAAIVQLSVPLLAGVAGLVILDEPLSMRLLLAGGAILGGIFLVLWSRRSVKQL